MAHLNPFVSTLALSASAVSLGLLGCSADPGNGQDQTPYASAGGSAAFPAMGGGATPVVGNGGMQVAGTGLTPGSGNVPGGGAAPPTFGGAPPSFGGAPPTFGGVPPIGGAPAGGSGAGTSMGGTVGGGTGGANAGGTGGVWDGKANLDAMGNLIAPAPGAGFQLKTTTFMLSPGQEVFNCFHSANPNNAEFDVGEWDAQMSSGSHHFILYRAGADTTAVNTLVSAGCTSGFGGDSWLYTGGSPRGHLAMPDGVAMVLAANERIKFDMHYINTGTEVIQAHIVLNVNKVKAAMFQKADAQVSFNIGISIPPNGMQTVGGDCTPVQGANYFLMQTHTHKRGILATVTRVLANGQMGEELVHTTNWDTPDVHLWPAAPFLTFKAGEKFHYSCTYQNDRATTVTVGTSAANNEMCMAEAYFFPASGTTPGCT